MSTSKDAACACAEALPLLLTATAVAKLTSLSPRTVWRLSGCGRMPAPLRVGTGRGRCLWQREAVEAWVSSGCRPLEDRP